MTRTVTKVPGTFSSTMNRVLIDPVSEQLRQLQEIPLLDPEQDGLQSAILNGLAFDANIEARVQDATIERTTAGASTITITLADPERELLAGQGRTTRGGGIAPGGASFLTQDSPDLLMKIDGYEYSLVKVGKQGPLITLTLEDYLVSLMRQYNTPRKAYRDKVTRAQFAHSLVREVWQRKIGFMSPNEMVKQPIAGSSSGATTERARADDAAARRSDFKPGASIKVWGESADRQQLGLLRLAMRICDEYRVPWGIRVGLIATMTQESSIRSPDTPDSYGSVGVLQAIARPGYAGNKAYSDEWQIRELLTRGFTGSHGYEGVLKSYARKRWGNNVIRTILHHLNPGAIDGDGLENNYRKHWDEALNTAKAWEGTPGGTGVADGSGAATTETVVQRYAYTRGSASRREDTWTCLGRLASEVNWRRFMLGTTLYFISEADLINAKPNLVISEQSEGVDNIDFDFDYGKRASSATVTARAGLWTVPPGMTVEVEELGPANGRWLVSSVRRSLYSPATEIALTRPQAAKPEPAPTTTTRAVPGSGDGGGSGAGTGKDVERVLARLKSDLGRGNYFGGAPGEWCADYVNYILKNVAGLHDIGTSYVPTLVTNIRNHQAPFIASVPESSARPGDVLCWGGHTGFYIGDGMAISGNWSSRVSKHGWKEPSGGIRAIGRPDYKS